MRDSLRVGVPRVAVMDGTGQRVQLLQWYPKSHPHVGRDQIPAGHAKMTRKCKNELLPHESIIPILLHNLSGPAVLSSIMQVLVQE